MLTLSVNNAPCSHLEKTLTWQCWLKSKQSHSASFPRNLTCWLNPGTWPCWLKSKQKQFRLSQNTPKRCILHSNTHCLVKNRATSQFVHNFSTFSSSRPRSRSKKNRNLFNKFSLTIRKTHTLSGCCLYVFCFSYTAKNHLLTTVKTNIQKHCTVNCQFSD